MSKKTRLFFVTDVHGSEKCFRKFVNAAKFYEAQVLVLGGDITGKMVIPIVDQSNGAYNCRFLGNELVIKSKEDLDATVKNIRDSGFYPYMSNQQEVAELQVNKAKLDALFERLMVESIDSWVKLAHERLSGTGVKCYISPGNDDILAIDSHLANTGAVFNPERKVVQIDETHEMITLGYTNPEPCELADHLLRGGGIEDDKVGGTADDRILQHGDVARGHHVKPILKEHGETETEVQVGAVDDDRFIVCGESRHPFSPYVLGFFRREFHQHVWFRIFAGRGRGIFKRFAIDARRRARHVRQNSSASPEPVNFKICANCGLPRPGRMG